MTVPAPKAGIFVAYEFRAYTSAKAGSDARRIARDWAEKVPLAGTPATGPFAPLEGRLPASREIAANIKQMADTLEHVYAVDADGNKGEPEELKPLEFARAPLGNASLYEFLWQEWQAGQRTVYSKLIDLSIEAAKKNSAPESGDGSSPE